MTTINQPIRSNRTVGRERLLSMPRASVFQSGVVGTDGSGAFFPIAWDSLDYDTDGMRDPTAGTRLTARTNGLYLVTAAAAFGGSVTGYRKIVIQRTTSDGVVTAFPPVTELDTAGVGTNLTTAWPVDLAASDYVEVYYAQTSGGSLAFGGDTTFLRQTGFTATLLSTP